ncbi:MAG TPA: carboxypeptidase M32 [Dongiaceae bacterium]
MNLPLANRPQDNRPPAYAELERRFHRWTALKDGRAVLDWDTAVMMPSGGSDARTEQIAALDLVCHGILADPALSDLLDGAEAAQAELDPWQQANLHEMRRLWIHATALSPVLVEALAKSIGRCDTLWREARPASDFAMIRPDLEILLGLVREAARAKADKLGCEPYEALIDEFEPGMRVAEIDRLFADLSFLPALREAALEKQAKRRAPVRPAGPFALEDQQKLGRRLMGIVGFDFAHGRFDVSLHPFCGGVQDDVRITTRYRDDDFVSALMGTLHETGHAMYELGRPAAWRYQPVGSARGMALHESQSLLVEMQVCRSAEFLGFLAPLLREAFSAEGAAFAPENLQQLYARVEPGFIRVDADEVCYPSHVILRYRLEKALISGDLSLADLPGAWNDGMKELLGIAPPDDRRGCLQDIHWFTGAWGYFPTYTLGAMTAAQLYDAAKRAVPGIPAAIARGDFTPLMAWLGEHVHGQGSRWSSVELVTRATGKPLDPAIFKAHLERRYLA